MATKKVAKPKAEPKKTTAPVAVATTAPVVPPVAPEVLPQPPLPLDKAALVAKLKVARNTVLCGLPINAVAPIDEVIAELLKD